MLTLRRTILPAAALLLVGCIIAGGAVPARAQEEPSSGTESEEAYVKPLPDWSIKGELTKVQDNVGKFSKLIKNLGQANDELSIDLDRYMKDPTNELLASEVEKKLALHARRVSGDFDTIIADQDMLVSNFKELQRKLGRFTTTVDQKIEKSQKQYEEAHVKATAQEKDLVKLAVRIKDDPPEDPRELAALKREFARKYSLFRLQNRYVKGFEVHYRSRQKLVRNLEQLGLIFGQLQDKFVQLVDNLERERDYLRESIELQADTLRIKELIRDGITHGEQSIANVTEKLASAYIQVEAFTKIHESINENLNVFVESQETLLAVSEKINQIGELGGDFGTLGKDLDDVISKFAEKDGDADFDD